MGFFRHTEREKWAAPLGGSIPAAQLGLPSLDTRGAELYGKGLPRGVLLPRLQPDRPPVNYWMSPQDLTSYRYVPGQLILVNSPAGSSAISTTGRRSP